MITRKDDLLRRDQRNPTLGLQCLTRFIDDHHIELLLLQLVSSGTVKRSQGHAALAHQVVNTLGLSLAEFLAQ